MHVRLVQRTLVPILLLLLFIFVPMARFGHRAKRASKKRAARKIIIKPSPSPRCAFGAHRNKTPAPPEKKSGTPKLRGPKNGGGKMATK